MRRPVIPEDLYRVAIVNDAQISPDGTVVAFVATRIDKTHDQYRSAIWIARRPHWEPSQFTAGESRDLSPRWCPDGMRLAFLSDRAGYDQIWIIRIDGGEAVRVTPQHHVVSEFAWAPDGRRLVYVSRGDGYPKGSGFQGIGDPSRQPRVIQNLVYKRDGEGLLKGARKHLWIIDIEGSDAIQVTAGDWDDSSPAWSPDGSMIAFVSNRTEDRDRNVVSDVWVVSADGAEIKKLTSSEGPSLVPAWSPNGRWLAYVGHTNSAPTGYTTNPTVWLVPAAGGRARSLTASMDRPAGGFLLSDIQDIRPFMPPEWSPDSQHLYYLATDRGNVHLFELALSEFGDVQAIRRVVAEDRQVLTFTLSRDGNCIAFTSTNPVDMGDVYVVALATGNEHRVTSLNRVLMDELDLGQPEDIECEASDGTPIQAWVIRPPGNSRNPLCPLVLHIHGGPHYAYGNAYMHEFQVLAGAGYAVLYANPRGSQGYGQEFVSATRGDWAHLDADDLLRSLDAVIKTGNVDESRIGVAGGSFGGYMVNWLIAHTKRFRAAVSQRGTSNRISAYGTSDRIHHEADWEFLGPPWEQIQLYLERSPLFYAQRITTPLLLLHGEEDLVCPIEQAEQLYVALKKLRREVQFVRYPGESHALPRSGRPSNRVDLLQRTVAWFARFLEPGESQARELVADYTLGPQGERDI
jgi:dipeptidyl aminopeptidase/acylaminoacyl peptidase